MERVLRRWSSGRAWRVLLAGVMSVLAYGVALVYTLVTWAGPHRPAMALIYAAGAVLGVLLIAGARRIAGWRGNRAAMFAVGVVSLVLVGAGAVLDGGAGSPAALGFTAPAMLYAVTCPPRVMLLMEALLVTAYAIGARLGEPVGAGYVVVSLGGMLAIVTVCSMQASMLAVQRRELHRLAQRDPLTGALNRRGLEQTAAPLFAAADGPVSVICFDFDDFKRVNDTDGHAAGDHLLRWAVQTAHLVLPLDALLARTGGDEFIAVLPGRTADDADATAGRLRAALAARVGVSCGTATAPADGSDLTALLTAADRRLYRAKRRRRISA